MWHSAGHNNGVLTRVTHEFEEKADNKTERHLKSACSILCTAQYKVY